MEAPARISVRPLAERDLASADRIFRLAFGTFLGMPDPLQFMGDADYVRGRWLADPRAAFAAELDGELIGSNFATGWGSVGTFGPLTIHPAHWDRGVGKLLLEPVLECFERWSTRHAGLFTFADSRKHVGLYQKFGFWPRFLTAIMSRAVSGTAAASQRTLWSELSGGAQAEMLEECRRLTDAVHEGLDVSREIRAVEQQGLGDTLLLHDRSRLAGLAVCHHGPGSEGGTGTCYVKFAAVRPSKSSAREFDALLDEVEALAAERGLARIAAGVNTARSAAYRRMLERGFRTDLQGVAMHRPDASGYSHPEAYVIDDWR